MHIGTLDPPVFIEAPRERTALLCAHCATTCPEDRSVLGGKSFCCAGCQTVYELLEESGLTRFYELSAEAGRRVESAAASDHYQFLDTPSVRERLVDYSDPQTTRVTFELPAIHCVACVWLLENLFRLKPGIGSVSVHFPRKQVAVSFDPAQVRLGEVAALLDALGYPPELRLADLGKHRANRVPGRLWLQIGLAGFAFGNTMLFSLPSYLGLDADSGPSFLRLAGWLSLALSVPVVAFSAGDYWRASWNALRQRRLTIEVPIVAGITALFLQSAYDVIRHTGPGYFDSLAGLLFFLLLGRVFQQKTHDRLVFDRDYRSFFPLSIRRQTVDGDERVALDQLGVGDRVVLRNGELVPSDSRVVSGPALIDYGFVTGEATPVVKGPGELLYAGGRQVGGTMVVETVKPVSRGYLTSLWDQEVFRKVKDDTFDTLTNRYSQRFTGIILVIALGAALFWLAVRPSVALKAFTSVLIVACPCALALAAPFTLGAAQRALGRNGIFLRNAGVVEALARVDAVVFDKTGTLTRPASAGGVFTGNPLTEAELNAVRSVAAQSTHPLARRLAADVAGAGDAEVKGFVELAGSGIKASCSGREVRLGSRAWVGHRAGDLSTSPDPVGSEVWLGLDGVVRGAFRFEGELRPGIRPLLQRLAGRCRLVLLSGDNGRESDRFRSLFGADAPLEFDRDPHDKLDYVRNLQVSGRRVMMVGDGLNDAGALQQSDVGVAVVEEIGTFSPASDVILAAEQLSRVADVLEFARGSVRGVRQGFLVSSLYNVVGLGIAASGNLSPVVCAVLMPLSSVTVVGLACLLTEARARRCGLGRPAITPGSGPGTAMGGRPS